MGYAKIVLGIGMLVTLGALTCFAQSYRYIDSSGNIHFADSLKKVPREYRQQVVPYTPTPVLDRRQQMQKYREEQAALRRQQAEKRRKELDAARNKRMLEREAKSARQDMKQQQHDSGFKIGGF